MAGGDEALALHLQAVRLVSGWTEKLMEEEVRGGPAGMKAEATGTGAAEMAALPDVTGTPSSQCSSSLASSA